MERFALLFKVRPGTEEQAAEVFKTYGRPHAQVNEDTRLLSTTVFMKDNIIVRLIEIDGNLSEAFAFIPQQEAIRKAEEQLNHLLETPRDLSDPEVARRFFQNSLMTRITHREAGKPVR